MRFMFKLHFIINMGQTNNNKKYPAIEPACLLCANLECNMWKYGFFILQQNLLSVGISE